jgi:hypothetical protein
MFELIDMENYLDFNMVYEDEVPLNKEKQDMKTNSE